MNSNAANNEPHQSPDQDNPDLKRYSDLYLNYASTLKNWYVVYGIGGIALLFTSEKIVHITFEHEVKIAVVLFIAVLAQVSLALFRKWVYWFICYGMLNEQTTKRYYIVATRFSRWAWIDIILDLVSFVCFAYAGFTLLSALGATPVHPSCSPKS